MAEYNLSNPSVSEEERMIQDRIDAEYEARDIARENYYKEMEEAYYKAIEEAYWNEISEQVAKTFLQ